MSEHMRSDEHLQKYPMISVITVTRNAARTLKACLESVAAQTYPHKEHIIIDNLSDDGTAEMIEAYAARHPHIRFISEKDDGIYDAMNKGVRMASGEWIYFLGSDDTLADHTVLEKIAVAIGDSETDVLLGDVLIERDGQEVACSGQRVTFEQLITEGNPCHQSMLVKKSLFDRFGYFDTRYTARADYAFNLRLFADEGVVKKYVPLAIARYNTHGFSSTVVDQAFAEDRRTMLQTMVSSDRADKYAAMMAAQDRMKERRLKRAHGKRDIVVYTAIFGGKDVLKDPPDSERCDFVCFTDNPDLQSDIWDIRVCQPTGADPRRSAKLYKINPHLFLPEYGYSIWIDGSVRIKDAGFYDLSDAVLKDHDMALYRHPARNCIYQEFEECVKIKKDKKRKMCRQIHGYRKAGYPENNGLVSGVIIFRRNSEVVRKINEEWWREIELGSVRDQLSFNYVAWKNGFRFFCIDESVRKNAYEEVQDHIFEDVCETWHERCRMFLSLLPVRLWNRVKKVRGLSIAYVKNLLRKAFAVLRKEGIAVFLNYSYKYVLYGREYFRGMNAMEKRKYALWIAQNEKYDSAETEEEMKKFVSAPKISIITPVYNTDPAWLERCIGSVRKQSYENWELCLHDDASTKRKTKECLKKWENIDGRIRISYGRKNLHIAGASNEALKIATGEFVALLDHDDELSPHALYEVVKLLNMHPEADFIYSDEDKLEEDGTRAEPFFKPDFSMDLLLTMNYITHLSVFRKSIVDLIGGFRDGYDGSQDYDIILRTVEKTTQERIFHIPKILYHWRKAERSTALSCDSKNYAYGAAKKALADYLKRNDMRGEVLDGDSTGQYHIKMKSAQ